MALTEGLITFEEFKQRIIKLFFKKGNKKEDMKYIHEYPLEKAYESCCSNFEFGEHDIFSDESLLYYVNQIEFNIRVDTTVFPMSLEEFREKLVDLFLTGYAWPCTESEKVERIKYLKDLDVTAPDWIEKNYLQSCYRYVELEDDGGSPEVAFSDKYILTHQVDMLEMCYF